MTARSSPRHVLITGASSGLGAALAHIYARKGVMLSLSGRDAARLAQTAADCRALGATEVDTALIDVTDAAEMERWLTARDDAHGVDLVIANAGIGGRQVTAASVDELGSIGRKVVEINTVGVMNTITPLLPRLVARRGGHVAIVSSIAALIGLPDSPSYCASKAGASLYGDGLRRLVAPYGIRVSIIYPGFIDTPMGVGLPFRPYLWTTERAAQHIVRGLSRGRRVIGFPRTLYVAACLARLLPAAIVDRVLIWQHSRDRAR